MTLSIFPELRGLSFDLQVSPYFKGLVYSSVNGNEVRTLLQPNPRWEFDLSYEYIPHEESGPDDLTRIQEFFLQRKGSFEAFLFKAPETAFENKTLLGVGNGVTSQYTLKKTTGAFEETAGGVANKTDIELYIDNELVAFTDFELVDHRQVVFDSPPASGKEIRGTYLPLYRVRFDEDIANFNLFMSRLWELQSIKLRSIF